VFPRAKYIFAKKEIEYAESVAVESRAAASRALAYQQSVLPVLEAKQALLVDTDFALDDEVWLTPTSGKHTWPRCSKHQVGRRRSNFGG